MKRILFAVFFFLSCQSLFAQVQLGGDHLIVDYGNPKQFVVGGVLVTGTQYLDEGVLINLSGLVVGDTIEVPGDKITKAITNLWKQGLFSDVKVVASRTVGQTIFLELRLQERPRLSKFSFKGVSKSEADKIREKVKLERDKVVTENVIASTKNTVKNFYVDKGYLNALVTIREIPDTTLANREIMEIVVDKKSKVKIHDIEIEGNTAFKDGKLKRAMKDTKEKHWYSIFTSSKFLDDKY
ncbi:MAG TPA: POTRA domain-containing protein, partial [Bacteroidia bacterium]|nr:POTRA domain-containing protein [Bacteroidia bacterium]